MPLRYYHLLVVFLEYCFLCLFPHDQVLNWALLTLRVGCHLLAERSQGGTDKTAVSSSADRYEIGRLFTLFSSLSLYLFMSVMNILGWPALQNLDLLLPRDILASMQSIMTKEDFS